MSTLQTRTPQSTANCPICKGAGSYITDDFNLPEGERLYVQVCVRCNNEAGLPLLQLALIPTPGQITAIGRLIAELEELGDTEINAMVAARISGYDFKMAAKCVAKLQLRKAQRIADRAAAKRDAEGQPARTAPTGRYPDVPAGRYAVASRTGNNDLDFFKIDRPTEGRWAGYTFVKRIIGGHDDTNVRGAEARLALQAIVDAGIYAAGALYGQTIGECGRCGRHLTDETSRAQGYGPECITKVA